MRPPPKRPKADLGNQGLGEHMGEAAGPKKVAILGGGVAALVTAFEITSQPDWRERFDLTIHSLGWRLGGKCASSRGANGRIEEHGIHGFLGSYYNALPLMAEVYTALGRQPGEPLATFEEAFLPENFLLMWEWRNRALRRWPETLPTNGLPPTDGTPFQTIEATLSGALDCLHDLLIGHPAASGAEAALAAQVTGLVDKAKAALATGAAHGPGHPLIDIHQTEWAALRALILTLVEADDALRHAFIVADYVLALVRGFVADDIGRNGFDSIDDQNWSDWLAAHGAHPLTISSPLALTTTNLSYQYPVGDTTLPPVMAAGAYLHWTLRSFAYLGSCVWQFAAGTGETVIAPLYLVLKARGVKFEFFHKVTALRLSPDGQSVGAVEIDVQARLKDPSTPYQPLYPVKGLPCWPPQRFYDDPRFRDQLVEGEALRAAGVDLESYWTPWTSPAKLTLTAGRDYDQLIFAISIGAIPHLCADLIAARPAWGRMVAGLPTMTTQAMQIWLSKDMTELGWDIPLAPGDTVISATYLNPGDGQAEFRHLIPFEDWPADKTPKSLWYFCGLMSDHDAQPPFSDTAYPEAQNQRVRYQSIQYLQAGMGPLLPGATTDANNPPGDPVGFDFNLLVDTGGDPGVGIARFDSQFWRANIDPTERYVASPPGSTACRLKAWDSGFANMTLTGDWIYTGLNVGSLEGAVMSGKLAAHALSGAPSLATVIGYPAG
jgi:uncharacterized protein with NAD-binding domain and iron-sulfur cluster